MSKYLEHLLGKFTPVSVSGRVAWKPEQLPTFLSQFRLNEALKLIGDQSHKNLFEKDSQHEVMIEHHDGGLAGVAMFLIESSTDTATSIMTLEDLRLAIAMFFDMPEKIETEDDINSYVFRQGHLQGYFQTNPSNVFGRTLLMFGELWENCTKGRAFPIKSAVLNAAGLTVREAIIFSLFFTRPETHTVLGADRNDFDENNVDVATEINLSNQYRFFDWLTTDYSTFRKDLESQDVEPGLLKYRFNPLLKSPLIRPDVPLAGTRDFCVIAPVKRLIALAGTRGLYYTLYDHFQDATNPLKNPFRDKFGYVFNDYIIRLCERCLVGAVVIPEREYGSRSNRSDTVDAFVKYGNSVVLIEAKAPAFKKESKAFGKMVEVRTDIKKIIVKGIKQLINTRAAIQDPANSSLSDLGSFEHFEHIIITHDSCSELNGLIREEAKALLADEHVLLPEKFHWHSATIEEFEYIVGIEGVNLFEFLKKKRSNPDDDLMDFHSYYSTNKIHGPGIKNEYLTKVTEHFMDDLKAERVARKP